MRQLVVMGALAVFVVANLIYWQGCSIFTSECSKKFEAKPTSVIGGENVTLTWESCNFNSLFGCSLTGGGINEWVQNRGFWEVVNLRKKTTFSLDCKSGFKKDVTVNILVGGACCSDTPCCECTETVQADCDVDSTWKPGLSCEEVKSSECTF